MGIVSAPKILPRAFQYNQVARNGQYPLANTQVALAEHANHINLWCTQALELGCPIASIAAHTTAASRTRWRAAYHSSPFAQKLYVKFEAAQGGRNAAGFGSDDPFVKVLVELADGTDVGTAEFHFGAATEPFSDVPNKFGSAVLPIVDTDGNIVDIPADTDLFITVSDEQSARAIAVAIYEINQLPSTSNGYAATNTVAGSPILSADRQTLLTNVREQWLHGSAVLLAWSSNTDATAPTRTSTTPANWIDQTVTTASASSPGVKLHLANKSTVRRTTVPVKLWVYGTSADEWAVDIRNSSDAVEDTLTISAGAAAWNSLDTVLPATDAKYDLFFYSTGAATDIDLLAVSLWQYET